MGFGVVLCLALLTAPAAFAAPSAASSSLDKIYVMTGDTLTVQANGFNSGEGIVSWASSAGGAVYATTAGTADSSGNVSLAIKVGRFWQQGWWAITVHGLSSGNQAISTFNVSASPPDGMLQVSVSSVAAGGAIGFYGSGFQAGEAVSIWATQANGAVAALPDLTANSNGEVSFGYLVPANGAAGTWAMSAYGESSGRFLVVNFTVTS